MQSVQSSYREQFSAITAPPLILLGGFLSFVSYHDYDVFAPELLICYFALIVPGMIIGAIVAVFEGTHFASLVIALLLFQFADLQFDAVKHASEFISNDKALVLRILIVSGAFFVALFVILSLRQNIATICATASAAFLLSVLILPVGRVSFGTNSNLALEGSPSNLPPVIHIVLDGHIGVEGIPEDINGGEELKSTLKQFYGRWGFRLFGRAYSQYFMTGNSLGNLLNGASSHEDIEYLAQGPDPSNGRRLKKNAYFLKRYKSGYRINVYESEYLDFCSDSEFTVEHCHRYPATSIRVLRDFDLHAWEKAKLIMDRYFQGSGLISALHVSYEHARLWMVKSGFDILPRWDRGHDDISSLAIPAVMRRLKEDILAEPRGRLFFAHLLLPHGPYVWGADCKVTARNNGWLARRLTHHDLSSHSSPQYRIAAYERYFDQVRCVISLLDDVFTTLRKQGLWEDTIVIVHGDHGSRITIFDPVVEHINLASSRDYIDAFSTLFAIRSDDIESEYDKQQRAITNLFAEFVLGLPPPGEDGIVYLRSAIPSPQMILQGVPVESF